MEASTKAVKIILVVMCLFVSASMAQAVYWVDVTVYGATGDGSTDDTNALLDAFDAASSGGRGSVVFFPPGDYKITSALSFNSQNHANVTICGARGRDSTWKGSSIIFYGQSGIMLDLRDADFFAVKDIRLDGRNYATTGISMGFTYSGSPPSNILVENVTIQNIDGTAIDTGVSSGYTAVAESTVRNTVIETADVGIDIGGKNIKVFGGTIAECSETGIKARTSSSAAFYATIFRDNSIDVKYTGNDTIGKYSFNDVWFKDSTTAVFKRPDTPSTTKAVSDIRFDGCHLDSANATNLLDFTNCECHVHIYGGAWDSSGAATVTIPANMYLYIDSLFGDQLTYSGANSDGVYFPLKNHLRCRAHRVTSNQSVSSGSWTVVQFNGTDYDTGSKYDSTNHRYSPATAGYYDVKAKVRVASTSAGKQYIVAIRNSGTIVASSRVYSSAAEQTIDIEVCDTVKLTSSQYLEVALYHDAGTDQDVVASSNHSTTFLAVHRKS